MINTNEQNSNNLKDKKIEITNQIISKTADIAKIKNAIKTLESYDESLVPAKVESLKLKQAELITATAELEELRSSVKEVQSEIKNETTSASKSKVVEAINHFIGEHPSTAYIGDDDLYYYISDLSTTQRKQNIVEHECVWNKFLKRIENKYRVDTRDISQHDLFTIFRDADKSFDRRRYSISEDLWETDTTYLPFKHMEKYFIDQAPVTTIDPTVIAWFDQLMYSLTGGKEENQTHLEQWLVHKVINYKKAATTPDVVIVGHVGGNGKGILQEIMRQMFPASLCGKANTKTLTGNFNAIMLGKLLVFFDDQDSKDIPLEVVKQLAGASTMVFEKKGHDQYEAEKTHSSAWFSNTLPFKMTPAGKEGGVDRRFSVMRTNITFLESLRKHAKDQGVDMTISESKDLAERVVQDILLNRECIAQWFKHLQLKHSEVDKDFVLKALHGDDYQYFLSKQETIYDRIWDDLIVPSLAQGQVVPIFVIKEILRHETGGDVSEKTINKELASRIATSKIKYDINGVRKSTRLGLDVGASTKQGTVIENSNNTNKPVFDWSQVSRRSFVPVNKFEELINEYDYVFNSEPDDIEDALVRPSNTKYADTINKIKNINNINAELEDAD